MCISKEERYKCNVRVLLTIRVEGQVFFVENKYHMHSSIAFRMSVLGLSHISHVLRVSGGDGWRTANDVYLPVEQWDEPYHF